MLPFLPSLSPAFANCEKREEILTPVRGLTHPPILSLLHFLFHSSSYPSTRLQSQRVPRLYCTTESHPTECGGISEFGIAWQHTHFRISLAKLIDS